MNCLQLSNMYPFGYARLLFLSQTCTTHRKVQVEVAEQHIAEFLAAMKVDVDGSRAESGCLRFDLLHDPEKSNKFVFYEAYEDVDAFELHKKTPHYQVWADFKSKGHIINQSVMKLDGIDFQKS